jgi:hypothetical protein
MENLEEISNLDKNKLASFLGMLATLQSGDISSKLHKMAKESKYQSIISNKSSGKYGKVPDKWGTLFKTAIKNKKGK